MQKLYNFPGGVGSPNQAIEQLEACAKHLASSKDPQSSLFHAAMSVFESYGRQHLILKWEDAKRVMIQNEVVNEVAPIGSFLVCTEQSGFESGWILFASLSPLVEYGNKFISHKVKIISPTYVAITLNQIESASLLRLSQSVRGNPLPEDTVVTGPMLRVCLGAIKAINSGVATIELGKPVNDGKLPNVIKVGPAQDTSLILPA